LGYLHQQPQKLNLDAAPKEQTAIAHAWHFWNSFMRITNVVAWVCTRSVFHPTIASDILMMQHQKELNHRTVPTFHRFCVSIEQHDLKELEHILLYHPLQPWWMKLITTKQPWLQPWSCGGWNIYMGLMSIIATRDRDPSPWWTSRVDNHILMLETL
jgi:hypothetical protein